MSLFQELFELIFAAREISTVVEVGVESGQVSSLYADLGAAAVYCVEPNPGDEVRAAIAADPRLHLVEGLSPGALGGLPVADLYVLDGDHNYTVLRAELDWIMENAPGAVVVVHDVLWPCARRDLYYQPSPLPPEDRHPASEEGPTVWHDELTPAGFVGNGAFTAAVEAGGERNGILTAVEDALAADGREWLFDIVPAVFGFGLLAPAGSPGAAELFAAMRPYTSSRLLANLENNRIALYTRVLQLQHEAEALKQEIERLQADPEPVPEQGDAEMTDYIETVAMHEDTWGTFLEPDAALVDVENLHEACYIPLVSGYHADLKAFAGRSKAFDRIAEQIARVDVAYEDQCSPKHYFDVFGCVQRNNAELTRIIDLGVFMGGSASVLAGCIEPMGLELDLVDVNRSYLQFTYERLRRIYPGAISKVRMFHGDLPTYVRDVLGKETVTRALLHHDGAHSFHQVVKDLTSLYFVRDRVHSLAIQDTHLRGSIEYYNFVDAAVYAMFGVDVKYEPLGSRYPAGNPVTNPDQYVGNYFLAGQAEGMFIPFAGLEFKYPHPSMELETFMPVKADPPA